CRRPWPRCRTRGSSPCRPRRSAAGCWRRRRRAEAARWWRPKRRRLAESCDVKSCASLPPPEDGAHCGPIVVWPIQLSGQTTFLFPLCPIRVKESLGFSMGFEMADRIGVAVVGCGFFAQNHLNAWRDLKRDGVELIAVCDIDRAKAEAAAK